MSTLKKKPKMFTKTQLRRGEIEREKTDSQHNAEVIDFLPTVHGDVEDILCDLSGDPPDPSENSLPCPSDGRE